MFFFIDLLPPPTSVSVSEKPDTASSREVNVHVELINTTSPVVVKCAGVDTGINCTGWLNCIIPTSSRCLSILVALWSGGY